MARGCVRENAADFSRSAEWLTLREQPGPSSLTRLDRSHYPGFAAVHWTMRVEPSGEFREVLLHTCVRERLLCPTYSLISDHIHLMWLGLAVESDQLNGMNFFRCI
jgi:hypothetical protein